MDRIVAMREGSGVATPLDIAPLRLDGGAHPVAGELLGAARIAVPARARTPRR